MHVIPASRLKQTKNGQFAALYTSKLCLILHAANIKALILDGNPEQLSP
jgi:hypothetical protein